ncbi:hypothetical protein NE237_003732 [Protea cynaroides]|uniref:FAF domain-containing protein n=1 Tax=Protea cynaroides TaxID=273540 RepID=A0A9Q0QSV6_9MAGN|nr:hypothetical protein NE237_003732 [Protea cynaroides]
MAVCGLQHIFEKPLPENPTLIESLSQWNRHQMKTRKSIDISSFSEIFGELHFHEKNINKNPDPSLSPQSPFSLQSVLIEDKVDNADGKKENTDDNLSPSSSSSSSSNWSSLSSLDAVDHHHFQSNNHNLYESFSHKSPKTSESLQLCTEGLGSESADDVEDFTPRISPYEGFVFDDSNTNEEDENEEEAMGKSSVTMHFMPSLPDRSRNSSRRSSFGSGSGSVSPSFPPPISCIGRSGKPWVCFRSYRSDGRFILKEIRIPTQEFLSSCREDGRLKLRFVQPNEEIPEEEEEEGEEEDNVVDDEVLGGENREADDQGDVC